MKLEASQKTEDEDRGTSAGEEIQEKATRSLRAAGGEAATGSG